MFTWKVRQLDLFECLFSVIGCINKLTYGRLELILGKFLPELLPANSVQNVFFGLEQDLFLGDLVEYFIVHKEDPMLLLVVQTSACLSTDG